MAGHDRRGRWGHRLDRRGEPEPFEHVPEEPALACGRRGGSNVGGSGTGAGAGRRGQATARGQASWLGGGLGLELGLGLLIPVTEGERDLRPPP